MTQTVRLTVAQAVVKFLANQYSERDGVEQRLFAGCFGIFGHGNVAGIGQALLQAEVQTLDGVARRSRPALHPGAQRAGRRARRRRLRQDEEPAADLGRDLLDRPRSPEHGDRCRAGDDQPAPGAAAALRHLRHPLPGPGPPAAGGPPLAGRLRQRRVQAGLALLGPDQPPRAAHPVPAVRDAGAHRPGRDRCGHRLPAAGRAGRSLRLPGGLLPQAGVARRPSGPRAGGAGPRGRGDQGLEAAADRRRRRRRSTPRAPTQLRAFAAGDRHPGRRHPGRQGRDQLRPPDGRRRRRLDRQQRRQRARP